jgi:hypothetical protein
MFEGASVCLRGRAFLAPDDATSIKGHVLAATVYRGLERRLNHVAATVSIMTASDVLL